MNALLPAVPLMPLAAGAAALALPPRLHRAAGVILAAGIAASLVVLLFLYGQQFRIEALWLESGGRRLSFGLELTGLTWFAATLVAAIALAITIYSIGYMADDEQRPRFYAELALFVGAMLALVLASSLVMLFAAWEIIGVASYLLIGFHHREPDASAAAAKAFLMTRIGDVGFLLAWLLVWSRLGTTDIATLLASSTGGEFTPGFVTLLACLFFAATIGKSAQLPLSSWLPDAMVAPTPVSALLHSATLVAAGVFLLLRLYPMIAASEAALRLILSVGFATAAVAALLALAQQDLKRVLAWSTVSQLGEMLVAIGLAAPLTAAMHLAAHAIFKSTLFAAAGAIDRQAGTRDLRRLGGLWHALPLTTVCFVVGALSLSGIQPLLTETSHDALLSAALAAGTWPAAGVLVLLLFAGAYIARAATAVFAGPVRTPVAGAGKNRATMQFGMATLALGSAAISAVIATLPMLLPFGETIASTWPVRIAAMLAAASGLAIGALIARRESTVPDFSGIPRALQDGLTGLVSLPLRLVHLTRLAAGAVDAIEMRLDALARHLTVMAVTIAGGDSTDGRVQPSVQAFEQRMDAAGLALAKSGWHAARLGARCEARLFGRGGDLLAHVLQRAGRDLRMLQTGKIYLYSLGLFAWTLLVLFAAALLLLS